MPDGVPGRGGVCGILLLLCVSAMKSSFLFVGGDGCSVAGSMDINKSVKNLVDLASDLCISIVLLSVDI